MDDSVTCRYDIVFGDFPCFPVEQKFKCRFVARAYGLFQNGFAFPVCNMHPRLFMDERFRAAEQALANSGYDLDMFDRQLLRLAFQCGWSDAEFDE